METFGDRGFGISPFGWGGVFGEGLLTGVGEDGVGDGEEGVGVDIVLVDNVVGPDWEEVVEGPEGNGGRGGEGMEDGATLELEAELGEVEVDGELANEGKRVGFVDGKVGVEGNIETSLVLFVGGLGGEVELETLDSETILGGEGGEGRVDDCLEHGGRELTGDTTVVGADIDGERALGVEGPGPGIISIY